MDRIDKDVAHILGLQPDTLDGTEPGVLQPPPTSPRRRTAAGVAIALSGAVLAAAALMSDIDAKRAPRPVDVASLSFPFMNAPSGQGLLSEGAQSASPLDTPSAGGAEDLLASRALHPRVTAPRNSESDRRTLRKPSPRRHPTYSAHKRNGHDGMDYADAGRRSYPRPDGGGSIIRVSTLPSPPALTQAVVRERIEAVDAIRLLRQR